MCPISWAFQPSNVTLGSFISHEENEIFYKTHNHKNFLQLILELILKQKEFTTIIKNAKLAEETGGSLRGGDEGQVLKVMVVEFCFIKVENVCLSANNYNQSKLLHNITAVI